MHGEKKQSSQKNVLCEYEVPTTTMKVANCDTQKKQNERWDEEESIIQCPFTMMKMTMCQAYGPLHDKPYIPTSTHKLDQF